MLHETKPEPLVCHWEVPPSETYLEEEMKRAGIDISDPAECLIYRIFRQEFPTKPYVVACVIKDEEFTEAAIMRCSGWDSLEDAEQACMIKQEFSDFVEGITALPSSSFGYRYFVVQNEFYDP